MSARLRYSWWALGLLALVADVSAVSVVTSSDVIVAECCGSGRVRVYNAAQVTNGGSAYQGVRWSHMWLATATSCDFTYNGYADVCCVDGNFRMVSTTIEGAPCPIEARGRSYAWVGGGTLPYEEHKSDSGCYLPCYCGLDDGEDGLPPSCLEWPYCY